MPESEHIIEGIPASPGIAIAQARILAQKETLVPRSEKLDDEEVEIEVERLRGAILEADKALERIEKMAREDVNDRAEIFEAHRMMLADPVLADSIVANIKNNRSTAHAAIAAEMGRLAEIFTGAADESMRSRAEDIRALQSHLIGCLLKTPVVHDFHNDAVLVLATLSPSDTVLYARNKASAFVLETGGINSHAAILARAFGIPMVACVREIAAAARPHTMMIVDGYTGRVIIDPCADTIAQYRRRKNELEAQRAQLGELRHLPAETTDGVRMVIAANIDMIDELESAMENGAEEIGLMRTEYLIMGGTVLAGMEDQLAHYNQIAERAYPMPVTFRLFDIGADKLVRDLSGPSSSPLGLRGLRLLLERRDLLENQVEALLRASKMKNLKIMLPMVSSVQEVATFREVAESIKARLQQEGVVFDAAIPIGAMIETPAAAVISDALTTVCDFFSLGTNDLAQYTLAVDRSDEAMAAYYDELHPAVLRLIRATSMAAARAGIPVTICGELAANPLATELLIGLGVRRFSVQPPMLGELKARIRSVNAAHAKVRSREGLRLPTAAAIRAFAAETGTPVV
ncbi:MAG TPA: phosphoenolpyruvate--protein phosphotransferase [Candidatus Kapabacteria bacterium]|nr:phosphoenolpyruvate--protein phosphotransferase [Candidatus Kapabacteria bacterium]